MSTTRKAESETPETPLWQGRWSSSEEFDRGLLINLVARRCSAISDQADRQLVYFLQSISFRDGGMERVADELRAMFPERIGTVSMQRIGQQPGQVYTASQVCDIWHEMRDGDGYRPRTAIKDAFGRCPDSIAELSSHYDPMLSEWYDEPRCCSKKEFISGRIKAWDEPPECCPAKEFTECCQHAARGLAKHLEEFCLNPAVKVQDASPWYFPTLIDSLREYQAAFAENGRAGTVVTEIGSQIYDTLDYAWETKCLVLIDGLARIGKSFAAKAWCDQRPGRARYVQVPSTNDDVGFFRAISKAIGVSCGTSWKAVQLRQRIEDTLQTGDLLLVMDEAHYLWPVSDYRHALPGRINWVMTALVNHGVPVALVTTPQFIATQKAVEKRTHWTSEQFTGRIGHYLQLPKSLGEEDLTKVALALLPKGDPKSIEILVRYAQSSAKYLAGIETAVRRARHLAKKAGRDNVERADIKRAIQEAVIPSDNALANALAEPANHRCRRNATLMQSDLTPSEVALNRRSEPVMDSDVRPADGSNQDAGSANRILGGNRLTVIQSDCDLVPS